MLSNCNLETPGAVGRMSLLMGHRWGAIKIAVLSPLPAKAIPPVSQRVLEQLFQTTLHARPGGESLGGYSGLRIRAITW